MSHISHFLSIGCRKTRTSLHFLKVHQCSNKVIKVCIVCIRYIKFLDYITMANTIFVVGLEGKTKTILIKKNKMAVSRPIYQNSIDF